MQPDVNALARLEQMRRVAARTDHFNCADLNLSRPPSSLCGLEHVGRLCSGIREPGSGIGVGFGTWDAGELLVLRARNVHQIGIDHALRVTVRPDDTRVEPERLVAESRHQVQRMRHEQNRSASAAEFRKLVETLVRECLITDREHFVDEQNIGVDIDRNRKTKAHVHAGRVRLHRRVDKFVELGKPDNVVEAIGDLATTQAEHQSVDVYILATGDFRMKSGAQLDERRHAPLNAYAPRRWFAYPGNQLEHRALAGAVSPDDAECRALWHVEGNALERLEDRVGTQISQHTPREQRAFQRRKLLAATVATIDLVHVTDLDRVHTSSGSVSLRRSNTKYPNKKIRIDTMATTNSRVTCAKGPGR